MGWLCIWWRRWGRTRWETGRELCWMPRLLELVLEDLSVRSLVDDLVVLVVDLPLVVIRLFVNG